MASDNRDQLTNMNTDRRANRRYELELEFDLFHLYGAKHLVWAGSGKTRNWSTTCVLVHSDRPLTAGASLQLAVRWSPGVQLIVVGRVVSTESRGAVVKILRRRFRGKPQIFGAASRATTEPVMLPAAGQARAC